MLYYQQNRISLDWSPYPLLPEMSDDDLDQCFALLAEGESLVVQGRHGYPYFKEYIDKHFRHVTAAGGVVRTTKWVCLMIKRFGQWDLPKGAVEPGENLRRAAAREVEEETGVHPSSVGPLLAETCHIHNRYGTWEMKDTSWFIMNGHVQPTQPQYEEEITCAEWVPWSECIRRLRESYLSLRFVADKMKKIQP